MRLSWQKSIPSPPQRQNRLFNGLSIAVILLLTCFWGSSRSAAGGQPAVEGSEKLVVQGNGFRSEGKVTEALWAYRQAAKAGNVAGAFAAGDLLFVQGQAEHGGERVLKLSDSLGYLFLAATNRHPQACARLADALQNGIGVPTNLVCAYAWLKLAAQYKSSFKADLDRLVVQLEPGDVISAQKMAGQFISGNWPGGVVRPVDRGDARLVVQGMSRNGHEFLIILNGGSLTVGEKVNVASVKSSKHLEGERLAVSCLEIGADYALIAVAGEPNLKLLPIADR